MTDRDTGKSKGFGFVEMANAEEAKAAISALNGAPVDCRTISVSLARPREDRLLTIDQRFPDSPPVRSMSLASRDLNVVSR
jgi:RNA recognition motif-containing protein